MKTHFKNRQIQSVIALTCLFSSGALAEDKTWEQIVDEASSTETNIEPSPLAPPPNLTSIDEAGINILSGMPVTQLTDLSIGNGISKLSHTIATYDGKFWGMYDDFKTSIFPLPEPPYLTVAVGHESQVFVKELDEYVPINGDGATLVKQADDSFIYTNKNGMQYIQNEGRILYPNGFEVTIHLGNDQTYTDSLGNEQVRRRRQSVTTNTGLQFKFGYDKDVYNELPCEFPYTGANCNKMSEWYFPIEITAINNAYEYCDPVANSCALNYEWPTTRYQWPKSWEMFALDGHGADTASAVFTVTDAQGVTTEYTHQRFLIKDAFGVPIPDVYDGNQHVTRLTKIKQSTSANVSTTLYTYKDYIQEYLRRSGGNYQIEKRVRNMLVDNVFKGSATWTYNHRQPDGTIRSTGSSIGPRGTLNAVMAKYGDNIDVKMSVYGLGISLEYDENSSQNLIESAMEHNKQTLFEHDVRGNMTKRTQVATDGSTNIIEMAGYDVTCDNLKTCNKPNWVQDAKGNRTDYTYHEASGYVATKTLPADSNGVRPQTRFFYEQLYAYVKNASGAVIQADSPVWVLVKESTCLTGSANGNGCAAAGDEVITQYEYGPENQPRNLWVKGVAVTSNGSTQRTCYLYDPYGNRIDEIKPKAGLSVCL